MRSYGKVTYGGGHWKITAEPHIILRLKNNFPRALKTERGTMTLAHNDEVCRDIEWFLSRWKLDVDPKTLARLKRGSRRHEDSILRLEQIIDPDYKPREFKLALPARDYQSRAAEIFLSSGSLLLADDVGLGKAQPRDSHVLTPRGWATIGELKKGDSIVDPDGGVSLVTGTYDRGLRETFRVTTADGASAECCDEHLWLVQTANDRKRNTDRVLPLSQFRGDLYRNYHGKTGWRTSTYFLPVSKAVEFDRHDPLPLNPYLMGALIGDGSFGESTYFHKGDSFVLDRVRGSLPSSVHLVFSDVGSWRITKVGRHSSKPNPVTVAIREMGLEGLESHEKVVPDIYLRSDLKSRTELLHGLMDTDGCCAKGGASAIYNTSSGVLATQVVELVRSLGGFASTFSKIPSYTYKGQRLQGRRAYSVNIRLPFNPFSNPKKASRWKRPYMARAIKSVVSVGNKPSVCISTTSKRGLYVTDGYLVTHNTVTSLCALTDPRTLPAAVVTLSGRMPFQWEDQCRKFLPEATTHIVTKGQPYELPKFMGRGPDIVILNYHKLAGWADTLAGYVKTVVYDEVQELRRPDSQRYTGASIVSAAAKFKIGLSATPIYNFGGEIYNVVEALRPGCLGEHEEFVREWCTGYSRSWVIDDPKAFGTYLRENFIMLRRTRAEVGRELPPLQKIVQPVDMDKEPLDAIEDAASELANIILSDQALARGDRMQAADELDWKLRHATGVGKAPHVADFVRILVENGERVLVYGWHRSVYDIWMKRLEDYRPAMFTGEESPAQKAESFRRFVNRETPVLLMSLRAGAGLDGLQDVCRTVVIGELDWSPGVMEQCVGRVFRDGQKEPVTAYFMLSDGGSDPVVAETCGVKREQVEGIKDPRRDLVQDLQSGAGRSQSLAKYYLKKIGRARKPVAAAAPADVPG